MRSVSDMSPMKRRTGSGASFTSVGAATIWSRVAMRDVVGDVEDLEPVAARQMALAEAAAR